MPDEKIILGIDPGTNLLGFGVIRALGRKAEYIDMGILDIRKEKDAYAKIHAIWEFTGQLCRSYHPDILAVESPFYAKNAQVWRSMNMHPARLKRRLWEMAPLPRSRWE